MRKAASSTPATTHVPLPLRPAPHSLSFAQSQGNQAGRLVYKWWMNAPAPTPSSVSLSEAGGVFPFSSTVKVDQGWFHKLRHFRLLWPQQENSPSSLRHVSSTSSKALESVQTVKVDSLIHDHCSWQGHRTLGGGLPERPGRSASGWAQHAQEPAEAGGRHVRSFVRSFVRVADRRARRCAHLELPWLLTERVVL